MPPTDEGKPLPKEFTQNPQVDRISISRTRQPVRFFELLGIGLDPSIFKSENIKTLPGIKKLYISTACRLYEIDGMKKSFANDNP